MNNLKLKSLKVGTTVKQHNMKTHKSKIIINHILDPL